MTNFHIMRFLFHVLKKYSIPVVHPIIKHLQQTDFIAQCFIFPDEVEVVVLAKAGLRVLKGEEKPKEYYSKNFCN